MQMQRLERLRVIQFSLMLALLFSLRAITSAQEKADKPDKPEATEKSPQEKEVEAHYRAMAEKILNYSESAVVSPMIKALHKQLDDAERQLSIVKKAKLGIDAAAKYKAQPKAAPLAYSSAAAKTAAVEELITNVKEIKRAVQEFDDKKCVFIADSASGMPVQEWGEFTVKLILRPNELDIQAKSGSSRLLQVLESDVVEKLKVELEKNPSGVKLPFPTPLVVTKEGAQEREYSPGKKYLYEVMKNLDRGRLEKLLSRGGKRVIWDAPVSDWRSKGFPYADVLKFAD